MNSHLKALPKPQIEFEGGELRSTTHDDIYFSRLGTQETDEVFLNPANILARIQTADEFTIGELGFGTGLNFLQTMYRYSQTNATCRLRFVSFESKPIRNQTRFKALSNWSHLAPFLRELERVSPPYIEGWHKRAFLGGRVQLIVYYGDVVDGLTDFTERDHRGVDAWFLDGFKPSNNPEMFSSEALGQLHRLSKVDCTVTSFTVARSVRETLNSVGFEVTKIQGSTTKRHTLLGTVRSPVFKQQVRDPVRIIGAGLAGSATAAACAEKGISVTLSEREDRPASGTSGIPLAIQHARLAVQPLVNSAYRLHAYAHAVAWTQNSSAKLDAPVFQFQDSNLNTNRLLAIAALLGKEWIQFVSPNQSSIPVRKSTHPTTLHYLRSRLIRAPVLCDEMVDHQRIELVTQKSVDELDCKQPTVICTGDPRDLGLGVVFEIASIEGQVDFLETSSTVNDCVIVRDGYIGSADGVVFSGSTYEYVRWPAGKASKTNRARIKQSLYLDALHAKSVYRGQRITTSDRFAICGPIGSKAWVNAAHGSSGTISALFAAEVIASQIAGEIPPGTASVVGVTDPYRFEVRQRRRPNPFLNPKNLVGRNS